MQWRMLQQEEAKDYVIATGYQISVRDFIEASAGQLGVTLRWLGLSLLDAIASEKTLLVAGRWRAFNFEGCHDRGLWYSLPCSNMGF